LPSHPPPSPAIRLDGGPFSRAAMGGLRAFQWDVPALHTF